jgi:hypothetical protein
LINIFSRKIYPFAEFTSEGRGYSMKDFIQIEIVHSNEIDKYLQKGWEIIETTKMVYDDGGSRLNYHIGFSARSKVNELKQILKIYEEYGFKEELFKKVAQSNGDNIDNYDESPSGHPVGNETVSFLEQYEATVNDKQTKFYKKLTPEEIAERVF